MKNIGLKIVMLLFLLLAFTGCKDIDNDNDDVIEPELYVASDNFILNSGDSREIEYFVEPEDLEVEFTVADEKVAIVEGNTLKALRGGETTLTVSLKDYPDIFYVVDVKVIYGALDYAYDVLDWAKQQIGTTILEVNLFPTTHPTIEGATITYESSNPKVLDNMGLIYPEEYNTTVNLKITVNYQSKTVSDSIDVVVGGSVPGDIAKEFFKQFSKNIDRDYTINYLKDKYPNVTLTFISENEEVFSNTGKFKQPMNDVYFNLYLIVQIPEHDVDLKYTYQVRGVGISIYDKASQIKEDIVSKFNLNQILLNRSIELPFKEDRYNAQLSWASSNTSVLSNTGILTQPSFNTIVELKCTVKVNSEIATFTIELEVPGKEYADIFSAVEEFLDYFIFKDEIKTQKYNVTGVGPSYVAYNEGYLPFYTPSDEEIIQDIINNKFRPKTIRSATKWVVIHDTANNTQGADAYMHAKFIKNEYRASSSWHYTVDDAVIIQHIPNQEVAWHAGTSEGNNYGIGIETCTNIGVDYNIVMRKTAKLTAQLLEQYGLTLYNVRQHYFFSGKDCPQVMRASNRWGEFLELVNLEYFARTKLKGVQFVWESLSPTIMDNTGKVINHPGGETEVSFKVTVTYNGVSKVYTHTAKLLPSKK